jgi:hypothetical protein
MDQACEPSEELHLEWPASRAGLQVKKPRFEPEEADIRSIVSPRIVNLSGVTTHGCLVDSTTQF